MGISRKLLSLLWVLLMAQATAGCSALLDPDNCESDKDCSGGVCMDGICVGERLTPDMSVSVDMAPAVLDASTVADAVSTEDVGATDAVSVPQDAATDMAILHAPTCSLTVAEALTGDSDVEISILVEDMDDDLATLDITLNGEDIRLSVDGRYEGRFSLLEGPNDIRLVVADSADQRCEASASVNRDQTPPIVELIEPALQSYLTNEETVIFRGSVSDVHFAPILSVLVDDIPQELATPITWFDSNFELSMIVTPGFQTVSLIASDLLGNTSEPIEREVEFDNLPPDIELLSPVLGQVTTVNERRFQVRGRMLDMGNGVRNPRISISVQSGGEEQLYPLVAGGITGDFTQWIELFNGPNEVIVCGHDEATNETCVQASVVKNAPCLALETPTDGGFEGALSFFAVGTICPGVTRVSGTVANGVSVAGELLEDNRFRIQLTALAPGVHTVVVQASNEDDESVSTEISITVDPSPPTLTFRSPEEGQCVGDSILVIGSALDEQSGLTHVTVNGAVVDQVGIDNIGGEFRQEVVLGNGERAQETITVIATNRAGLETERTTVVVVDTVAPLVVFDVLNLLMPINPWLKPDGTNRVRISGRLETGPCGIAQGRLLLNGLAANIEQGSRFELRQAYEDGQHNLEWTAEDIVGNEREGNYAFRVDSIAPIAVYTSPTNDSYQVSSDVTIAAQMTDGGSGVHEVHVNDTPVNFIGNAEGAIFETTIGDLNEGPNQFEISIADAVGNVRTDQFVIHRDSTSPQVTIREPLIGTAVPLPLMVSGTATDDVERGQGEPTIVGSGLQEITVNGVVANYDADTGIWIAHGVMVSPLQPILTVNAVDVLGNAMVPIIRNVGVSDYASQSNAIEGLGIAQATDWVDVVDLNADGRLDIVALSSQGGSASFLQNVNGAFTGIGAAQSGLPENSPILSAQIGDLDADGNLDLLFVSEGATNGYLGNGDGSFSLLNFALPGFAGRAHAALGDTSRDGRLDLLLLGTDDVRLYSGDLESIFVPEDVALKGLADVANFESADLVDVNSDGVLDLVAVRPLLGGQIWLGDRDGTFSEVGVGEFGNAEGARQTAWIDANRNGALDVFVNRGLSTEFYLNDGSGHFVAQDLGEIAGSMDAAVAISVADLDGDGRDDLIMGDQSGLRVYRNTPVGFQHLPIQFPPVGAVNALVVEDIDQDGDFDLVVGGEAGVQIIRSNRSQLVENHKFVHVHAHRQRNPLSAEPPLDHERSADGLGTQAFIELLDEDQLGNPDIAAEPVARQRALLLKSSGPTLVTIGDRAGLRAAIHFVDVGNQGRNSRILNDLVSEMSVDVYSPE
jgi:hypothetical protein